MACWWLEAASFKPPFVTCGENGFDIVKMRVAALLPLLWASLALSHQTLIVDDPSHHAALKAGDGPITPWQSGAPGEKWPNVTVCADLAELRGRPVIPPCSTYTKTTCKAADGSARHPAKEACCVCGGGEQVAVPKNEIGSEQKDLKEMETEADVPQA